MKHIHQPQRHSLLSAEPNIHESSHILNSSAGQWVSIGPHNKIVEAKIDNYTYTMDDVTINYSDIGKYTSIASHVCINPTDHPMDRVTQHHMTYRRKDYHLAETDDETIFAWRRSHRVTIGHDVWIGHGAIVMKGVTIGAGAVIGAGAIVTKDVEPYSVVVGVPARPIKKRFAQEVIDTLLDIAWWDWPRHILEERFYELNDLDTFIAKYK
ncbi:acetyltransferase [Bacillaceae bacterium SIJ1]|uniref:DapH/DapD/GlmU-related protein n=1 Tax=Litoribacterium kuwaitense TaxID=1398745 RepID=UPI0013EDB9B0|nr:DapH/DapD/GlmU-related protein [Litoribacterium kuwaitense]NGP45092.1 acetyltransferase [Litoribacterium kuwaitense]